MKQNVLQRHKILFIKKQNDSEMIVSCQDEWRYIILKGDLGNNSH